MDSMVNDFITAEARYDEEKRKEEERKEEERKKIQGLRKFIQEVIQIIELTALWEIYEGNYGGVKIVKKQVFEKSVVSTKICLTWMEATRKKEAIFSEEDFVDKFSSLIYEERGIEMLYQIFSSNGRKCRLIKK